MSQITLYVIHKTHAWLHNYSAFTYVFYTFIFINNRNKIIVEYTSHAAYIDHFIILTAALYLNHNLIMTEINSLLFCFRKTWLFRRHTLFKLISKIWFSLLFSSLSRLKLQCKAHLLNSEMSLKYISDTLIEFNTSRCLISSILHVIATSFDLECRS